MTVPEGVWVAYGDDALDATPTAVRLNDPAGIDVVNAWSVRRGRSYLTDKMDAGTASAGFVDMDGTLDPTNTGGTFYPMDPGCPAGISLHNPVADTWSPLFTGLAQGCPQDINLDNRVSRGSLEMADLFSLLARKEVPPGLDFTEDDDGTSTGNSSGLTTYAETTVNNRIKAILADAGVPSGLTNIFSGNVRVQETVYSPGDKILAALQDAADAEFPWAANIFVGKDGVVNFRGRLARSDPGDYGINTWHVGDATAVAAHSSWALLAGITIDRDINKIVNNALFAPQGIEDADLSSQLVTDGPSITQFGPLGQTGSDLLTAGATTGPNAGDPLAETLMFGTFHVDNLKAAQTRIGQARFRWVPTTAANATAQWLFLCGIEIDDIVVVTTTHPGGGGFATVSYFVEGITYDARPGGLSAFGEPIPDLTLTLDLSPAAYYLDLPAGWDQT